MQPLYNVQTGPSHGYSGETTDTEISGDDALFEHVSNLIMNDLISDDMVDSIEARSAMEALRKIARNLFRVEIGSKHSILYMRDDTTVYFVNIFRID